jgi:hypothetical protein
MTSPDPARKAEAPRLAAWVLILVGVSWLLAATGFVPSGFVRAGLALWPLLLIGFGLDLLNAAKLPFGIPASFVALAVIAVAGLFFPSSGDSAVRSDLYLTEPIADANRAEVAIDVVASTLLVRGGADEGALLEGTALGAARFDLTARGRGVRRLDVSARGEATSPGPLSGPADGIAFDRMPASTEPRLTDRIPLELEVLGHELATIMDLTGLDLAGFSYTGAAGPARITLGGGGPERYDAHIVGADGPIDLAIPDGARLNLRLEPGSGGAAVSVGARSDLTLILRAGNGPVSMTLPDNARIRVSVDDPERGILSLPDRLPRARGAAEGEETDVYETPGYRDVIPTIDIRIEEMGAGPVVIR